MALQVEGYDEIQEVARGGFGVVYRARHVSFDRVVAIKVLSQIEADDDAARRWKRECRAMGALSWHPNIVVVYDLGVTADNHPFLSMEFLDRGSLADRVMAEGPLPWPDAVSMVIQVSGALQAAHDAGVLHRDIKPENILVGVYGEAKLTDFGLATGDNTMHTAAGMASFTLAHASPEALRGERVTTTGDVYSLGSTLYHLLAGRPPYVRSTDENVLVAVQRVINDPVPDLRAAGVPVEVAAVVEAAMVKDSAARPQSPAELGRALQRVQQVLGVPVTDLRLDPRGGAGAPLVPPPLTPPPLAPSPGSVHDSGATVQVGVPPAGVDESEATVNLAQVPGSVDESEATVNLAQVPGSVDESEATVNLAQVPGGIDESEATVNLAQVPGGIDESGPTVTVATGGLESAASGVPPVPSVEPVVPPLPPMPPREWAPEPASPDGAGPADGGSPAPPSKRSKAPLLVGLAVLVVVVVVGAAVLLSGGDDSGDDGGATAAGEIGTIVANIPVGPSLRGLTVADGAVWVANRDDGIVSRIDAADNTVTATTDVGEGPRDVAVGLGSVWVASLEAQEVARLDPGDGSVLDTIAFDGGPQSVTTAAGLVWVTDRADSTVEAIDPDTLETVDEISVGDDPTSIVADGDEFLWVTNREGGTLSEIDLSDRRVVATVDVGEFPQEAAVDATSVWVASEGTSSLLRVDKATGEVADTLELGVRVEDVALDDDGHPWVDGEAKVIEVDPDTVEVIGQLAVGDSAGVAAGEGSIWVTAHHTTVLTRIDPT